jgi:hypothetical protein
MNFQSLPSKFGHEDWPTLWYDFAVDCSFYIATSIAVRYLFHEEKRTIWQFLLVGLALLVWWFISSFVFYGLLDVWKSARRKKEDERVQGTEATR